MGDDAAKTTPQSKGKGKGGKKRKNGDEGGKFDGPVENRHPQDPMEFQYSIWPFGTTYSTILLGMLVSD
jgi:hypothetical protein